MTRLMRASEVFKRPVVTFSGEDVAQIKDIVYSAGGGAVGGFTLSGRGIFASPLKQSLPWSAVAGMGADAVMIHDFDVLEDRDQVLNASATGGGSGKDVIGSRVLTDTGVDLGTVVDVIIETSSSEGGQCDVVGYEIEAADSLRSSGSRLLVPLPDTLSASGEHVIVPGSAENFIGQDLSGFGAAIREFRDQLRGVN
ncbi:MAG: PRC-barrel domain-containing protein [bacterium]|nr:PRC-barrel domain-containing protein [bacterium]